MLNNLARTGLMDIYKQPNFKNHISQEKSNSTLLTWSTGAKITLMQTQGQSNSYNSSTENGHNNFKLEAVQSKYNQHSHELHEHNLSRSSFNTCALLIMLKGMSCETPGTQVSRFGTWGPNWHNLLFHISNHTSWNLGTIKWDLKLWF